MLRRNGIRNFSAQFGTQLSSFFIRLAICKVGKSPGRELSWGEFFNPFDIADEGKDMFVGIVDGKYATNNFEVGGRQKIAFPPLRGDSKCLNCLS